MQDKEVKKTLTFILVAGMAVLVAFEPWRPAPADTSVPERVGQKLFPGFENPLAAKSLEVVTFNEETAAIRDFKVAQTGGVWSIPSHSNYPADAKEHMAKAATSLMDLKILSLASQNQGDQKTYGVIDPDPKKLKVGMTGVGTRITVRDAKDKVLADLVIGKPVKDAPQLHYVREVGRDPIYTVRIDTTEFSTKFGDWIEKDLLKLNAFDVANVELNDYSTHTGVTPDGRPGLQLEQRSEIDLAYNDAKSEWTLVDMKEFDDRGNATPVTLAEGEQLNSEKLNAMKTALQDLKIIDVERKPTGLSRDLRASEEFVKNREALISLQERGFIPAAKPNEPIQIYSSEGEVTCTTKDGVKYILRFGDLAGTSTEQEPLDKDNPDGETKSTGPSRFLFVTAQFDESQIPKPDLQAVPGEDQPPADKADEKAEAAEAKPADDKPAEEKPAEEKPAAEAAESTPDQPAGEKPAGEDVPETKTAAQEAAEAQPAGQDKPAEADDSAAAAAEKPVEQPAEKPAEQPAEAAAEAPSDEPAKTEAPATPEEAEIIAIRKENKRKQDEYDEAVKRGQDKVQELNDRFADWYYIISDDVYKKIHLGRADIIKTKEVEAPTDLGNLKQLQEGLGKPATDAPVVP